MTLAETISNIMQQQDDIQRDMGLEGSTTFYFNLFQDFLTVTTPYVVNSTRGIGSSFVLGHPNTGRCWLGAVNTASVACGSQPYLGDSRTDWSIKNISSPNNTFIETFDGSRFIKLGTGGTYTETTDQSDLIADSYVYYPYFNWMRFDISAFSGKPIDSASLFMRVSLTYPSLTNNIVVPNLSIWYVNKGSEFIEGLTPAVLSGYGVASGMILTCPWSIVGQLTAINIKPQYDISHTVGSSFLTIKMTDARNTVVGSLLGTNMAEKFGNFKPPTGGSLLEFYDRTNSLNYPYLKVQYTLAISGTTASWGSGSLYLVNGSAFETPSIYTGSSTLSNIDIRLNGSTYNNLQLYATPNNVNWESCNSASVANYNFANTGSDLRLKFVASGGNAMLTKYECAYGLN